MIRYLSGLCVAGLGVCGGGWLVVAALVFGGESGGRAVRVDLLTGAALIAVGCLSLVCWSCAWRQRLRADGVLADRFPLVPREAPRNRRALSRDVRRAGKLAQRSARAASEGVVLGEGVALGVASPGDEQYSAAASPGPGANGSVVNGAGANPGERAAELITELRSMLEPLLAAAGGRPALAEQPAAPVGQATAAAPPLPQRSRFGSDLRPRLTAADLGIPGARAAPMSIPRLAPAFDDTSAPASDGEEAWW